MLPTRYGAFMARASEYPPVTAFSRAFSEALSADMKAHGVTHQAVADVLPPKPNGKRRSRPFVSEQVSGKRPVDTDVLTAVAELAGTTTPALVRRVLAAMPPEAREGVVIPIRPDTPMASAARKTSRPPSKSDPDA